MLGVLAVVLWRAGHWKRLNRARFANAVSSWRLFNRRQTWQVAIVLPYVELTVAFVMFLGAVSGHLLRPLMIAGGASFASLALGQAAIRLHSAGAVCGCGAHSRPIGLSSMLGPLSLAALAVSPLFLSTARRGHG